MFLSFGENKSICFSPPPPTPCSKCHWFVCVSYFYKYEYQQNGIYFAYFFFFDNDAFHTIRIYQTRTRYRVTTTSLFTRFPNSRTVRNLMTLNALWCIILRKRKNIFLLTFRVSHIRHDANIACRDNTPTVYSRKQRIASSKIKTKNALK